MFRTRILVQNRTDSTYNKKDGSGQGVNIVFTVTMYEDGYESTIDLKAFGKTAEKLTIGKTYDIGLRIKGNEWNGKNYAELSIIFADEVTSFKPPVDNQQPEQKNESPAKQYNTQAPPFNDDDKDDLPF